MKSVLTFLGIFFMTQATKNIGGKSEALAPWVNC